MHGNRRRAKTPSSVSGIANFKNRRGTASLLTNRRITLGEFLSNPAETDVMIP